MTQYLIAVTATSDAVDYDYFRDLAEKKKFDFFCTRMETDNTVRRNMTFIPRSYTSALNHHDVIECLGRNSPLLVTYEIHVIED